MKKAIVIILSAVLLFCFTGCSAVHTAEDAASDSVSVSVTEAMTKASGVAIATDYGTMSFPVSFEDIVIWEQEDTENGAVYTFYAVLNSGEEDEEKKTAEVYSVIFETEEPRENDYFIGTLPDNAGGKIYVRFDPVEDIITDDMTEEDEELVYSAQETVNDIVESVRALPGFEENN